MNDKKSKVVLESMDSAFEIGYRQGYEQGLKSINKWIPIDKLKDYNHVPDSKIFVRFDTGEVVNYNDKNWPFALSTHFLIMD